MKLPRRRFLQLAASAAALPAISGENQMPTATLSQAELTTMASCPANYFLENFALRADKSALITTVASFSRELLFGELSAARRQFGTGYSNESEGTVVCPAGRSG
jgi:hypothetical protein